MNNFLTEELDGHYYHYYSYRQNLYEIKFLERYPDSFNENKYEKIKGKKILLLFYVKREFNYIKSLLDTVISRKGHYYLLYLIEVFNDHGYFKNNKDRKIFNDIKYLMEFKYFRINIKSGEGVDDLLKNLQIDNAINYQKIQKAKYEKMDKINKLNKFLNY